MTTSHMEFLNQLPDPERDAQFYSGVQSKRLVAWIIDFVIIGVFSVIAAILTFGIGFFIFPILVIAVSFLYRTMTLASSSSTWGMRMMGIEIRSRFGDRLDWPQAAIHTGIFLFLMASVIGWIATVICMLGTRYGQGIPDLVLGSTAINRPID